MDTIISLELKQLAESLSQITHRRTIQQDIKQLLRSNCPALWRNKRGMKTLPKHKGRKDRTVSFQEVDPDQAYKVKFDDALQIASSWIDGKTLGMFNRQRDNIHASSSKIDVVMLRAHMALYHTSSPGRANRTPQTMDLIFQRKPSVAASRMLKDCRKIRHHPQSLFPDVPKPTATPVLFDYLEKQENSKRKRKKSSLDRFSNQFDPYSSKIAFLFKP